MVEGYTIKIDRPTLMKSIKEAEAVLQHQFYFRSKDPQLAKMLGAYTVLRQELSKSVNGKFSRETKEQFLDVVAIHLAARYACNDESEGPCSRYMVPLEFATNVSDPNQRRRVLFTKPLYLYRDVISKDEPSSPFIRTIAMMTGDIAEQQEYAPIANYIAGIGIEIEGRVYDAITRHDAECAACVDRVEDISLDEIVGNDDLKDAVLSAVEYLAEFRSGTTHPLNALLPVPKTNLVFGPPGTGKTSTIKAVYSWAKEHLEPKMATKLLLKEISCEQRDKYFGETQKNIAKVFNEIERGENAYLVIFDDVDLVVTNRENQHASPEEGTIIETILRRLEGIKTNSYDNVVYFFITNKPMSLDTAIQQRFSQMVVEVPGPQTLEERIAILKKKLHHAFEHAYIDLSEESFKTIGELLQKYQFNGRLIRNISTTLGERLRKMLGHDPSTLPGERFYTAIQEGTICINKNLLLEVIEDVHMAEEKQRALQLTEEVERYKHDILVRNRALRELVAEGTFPRESLERLLQ